MPISMPWKRDFSLVAPSAPESPVDESTHWKLAALRTSALQLCAMTDGSSIEVAARFCELNESDRLFVFDNAVWPVMKAVAKGKAAFYEGGALDPSREALCREAQRLLVRFRNPTGRRILEHLGGEGAPTVLALVFIYANLHWSEWNAAPGTDTQAKLRDALRTSTPENFKTIMAAAEEHAQNLKEGVEISGLFDEQVSRAAELRRLPLHALGKDNAGGRRAQNFLADVFVGIDDAVRPLRQPQLRDGRSKNLSYVLTTGLRSAGTQSDPAPEGEQESEIHAVDRIDPTRVSLPSDARPDEDGAPRADYAEERREAVRVVRQQVAERFHGMQEQRAAHLFLDAVEGGRLQLRESGARWLHRKTGIRLATWTKVSDGLWPELERVILSLAQKN